MKTKASRTQGSRRWNPGDSKDYGRDGRLLAGSSDGRSGVGTSSVTTIVAAEVQKVEVDKSPKGMREEGCIKVVSTSVSLFGTPS